MVLWQYIKMFYSKIFQEERMYGFINNMIINYVKKIKYNYELELNKNLENKSNRCV